MLFLRNLFAIACEWGKIPRVDTLLCCQSGGSGDYADIVSGARYGDGAKSGARTSSKFRHLFFVLLLI